MNNESIFDKVKNYVNIAEVVERFGVKLDRVGKGLCPFHKEDTPSFSVKKDNGIFKCFGCNESGDAIDFVAKLKGIDGLEAAKLLAEIYGIGSKPCGVSKGSGKIPAKTDETPQKATVAATSAKNKAAIKKYIVECISHAGETDYFAKRGLTQSTVEKFRLGYDPMEKRIIIPYSSALDYYCARSTVLGHDDAAPFIKKPKSEVAGAEPLWNKKALESRGVVFVTESQICALSIMQCGGTALSICGTGGVLNMIRGVKDLALKCIFVLCLDNDDPGKAAQQELANSLFEAGKQFIAYNIAGDKKDPNELLVADPDALKKNIREAIKTAKTEFSKLKDMFNVAELQKVDMPPIKWIVKDLLPEGLSLVTAPSKYGKSWMMMQLCTAVAEGKPFLERQTVKCDVAYFSLEDSKRRFRDRVNAITGGKPAPQGFFGSTKLLSMATGLFEQLEELMERYPNMGLIIIDIFQKVRGGQMKNESVYGADYREMGLMKAFADKHKICLLLVHHLRKQDDDGDVFNRISGSMAIMGAADTSWVLSRKKRGDTNTMLTVTGRDVDDLELIVTFDRPTVNWVLVGDAADEAARKARADYEGNPVVKTIKKLVEKHPGGWCGNCSEIKLQIYEQTGVLFDGSADTVGRIISKYLDRLSADGITHSDGRGKRHSFARRQPNLFNYHRDDD